jgi:glycosyltransferase involved in cell wall biosynthesis
VKRVLVVAYHYPPEGSSSGVLRTLKYTKYLPAHGWAPHVLTLQEAAYPIVDPTLLAQIPESVSIHRTRGFDVARRLSIAGMYPGFLAVPDRFALSWWPFAVARGLRVIRRLGVDALYSTSPQPTAHLIAATLKAATGVPWVADFRDPWIEDGAHPRPGSLRYGVESRLERMVVRTADKVTVTTPLLGREFLHRYPFLSPDKVVTIFNGYDERDFEGLKFEPPDDFEILHTGLVTPSFRDPAPLLRAVAALIRRGELVARDTRVAFLGGGEYLASQAFRDLVAQLDLDGVVDVGTRVSYQEALARLGRASVLVLLQASDDTRALIPAKGFEYLRAGRPILALTLPGATAELVQTTRSGVVVDPTDVEGIGRALVELRDADWALERRDDGFPGIDRFERRALTAQLATLLDELTGSRP